MLTTTTAEAVTRLDLETLEPGLYLLDDEPVHARVERIFNLAGDKEETIHFTGHLLARIRNCAELPSGSVDAWNRSFDGRAVVVVEETILA